MGGRLSCRERPGREPPAQVLWGSGCARPGEERKTTGGEGGSGRERERGTRVCRRGDPQPSGSLRSGKAGPSGSLRSGKTSFLLQPHAPRPGQSSASQPYSLCPLRAVLAPGMGRVTLGDLAAGLFPRAGHTSRHQRPSGWASQASALRPLLTLSILSVASDPPSPPGSRRPLHPGYVGGKGESFRAWKLPALSPRSPSPRPPSSSPPTAHQIEAALH